MVSLNDFGKQILFIKLDTAMALLLCKEWGI